MPGLLTYFIQSLSELPFLIPTSLLYGWLANFHKGLDGKYFQLCRDRYMVSVTTIQLNWHFSVKAAINIVWLYSSKTLWTMEFLISSNFTHHDWFFFFLATYIESIFSLRTVQKQAASHIQLTCILPTPILYLFLI